MRAKRRRNEVRKYQRATNFAVAIILTFCIVFALLININTRNVRKERLVKAEAQLVQKELELQKMVEQVEAREQIAEVNLTKAAELIDRYGKSLSEAILVQYESKQLIQKYELINQELIESLVSNESLEKQHLEQLEEVKKLRAKTLSMRQSVLNFYHKTKKDQKIAKQEIAKSQRAYEISVERLKLANQRKRQADATLAQNQHYANTVSQLKRNLAYTQQNNSALQNQVYQSQRHINYHHHQEKKQRQPCQKPAPVVKPKKPYFPPVRPSTR